LANFELKGKETIFVGPSPEDLNVKESDYVYPVVAGFLIENSKCKMALSIIHHQHHRNKAQ
jgi:hypothetical protein